MVKLKFIIKDNTLVLRISEKKERYYKSVSNILVGNPKLCYWMSDKERFSSRASSCAKNNQVLKDFKNIYRKLTIEYPELTARQIASFYKPNNRFKELAENEKDCEYSSSIEKFLILVIEREKLKAGANFKSYQKLLNKCRKAIRNFSSMTFQSLNYNRCVDIANELGKYNGYRESCKIFRSLLGRADIDYRVNFRLSQIENFHFGKHNPTSYYRSKTILDVLTQEQIREFLAIDTKTITPQYKCRNRVELFHDFCIFMFYSFCAPCDVIKLKHSNITPQQYLSFVRKKTHKPTQVPIHPQMERIINKYKSMSEDGYIFPIINEEKQQKYSTRDYMYNKFRDLLNTWLKDVACCLNWNFRFHCYVFRHTAISLALDNGLTLSYVSTISGSTPEILSDYYYNGMNENNAKKLFQVFENSKV